MKKAAGILLLVLLVAAFALPGSADMNKYSTVFMDTFDTVISLIGYAENQETFDARAAETHAMYLHLHKLFDTYNSYADEGITSVFDVNRQAAVEPVKVDPILFGLLTFCKSNYELVNGQTNVAMGSVLSIWHEYREAGLDDPENAKLPPMADLQAAAQHMNIDDLILDEAAQTVYFADPEMTWARSPRAMRRRSSRRCCWPATCPPSSSARAATCAWAIPPRTGAPNGASGFKTRTARCSA